MLFICNSILFSRFWIIFTLIILSSLLGRLLSSLHLFGLVGIYRVPLPAEYFSAFPLLLFNICSLCLIFISLINVSWGASLWFYPVWDSLGLLDLGDYFLPHFREVFNYYLLKYFLMVFLLVLFFWDSYDSNVGAFNIVLEVSEIVLISFNSFFFFPL